MNKTLLDNLVNEYKARGWNHAVKTIYSFACETFRLRVENAELRNQKINDEMVDDLVMGMIEKIAGIKVDNYEV